MRNFFSSFSSFSTLSKPYYQVVFLRHAESTWNKQKRFTGWSDVRLSQTGIREAAKAGKVLRENGHQFDICFTSLLTRAIQTFNYAADELDCHYIPIIKDWRMNERHYGALEGLNKIETVEKHGKQQTQLWRRSYQTAPPILHSSDERNPINDPRYSHIKKEELPLAQSLEDTSNRVFPYWQKEIVPLVKKGKRVIVVGHGNCLRALVKNIQKINEKDIMKFDIPTAIPLIHEFDKNFKLLKHYYLSDEEQLSERMRKVKEQVINKDENKNIEEAKII